MHFEDLDVPILAEASRRVLHQSGEQVNAQGCVTRLQNGNGLGGLIDERMMESLKAGRTDDDGLARPKTGVQMGLQRGWGGEVNRSEEHTSELQSLMRISYAVFCLKKTTTDKT